jgi:hypothetical protein
MPMHEQQEEQCRMGVITGGLGRRARKAEGMVRARVPPREEDTAAHMNGPGEEIAVCPQGRCLSRA